MGEVKPSLVWSQGLCKDAVPKLFCGVEECKPWTRSKDLPGRSYTTSNDISHPPLLPYFKHVEAKPIKLPPATVHRDYRYKKMHYYTSYSNAYKYKVNSKGLTDTPNVPHSTGFTLNYQWIDKLRTFPACKMDPGISEMKYHYKAHQFTSEGPGILNNLKPALTCQIYSPAKEAFEKSFSNLNCIQKNMDPYISTMKYDYVEFQPEQVRKYKQVEVQPAQIFEAKPTYDECFVKKKFLNRFIRKKILIVPHRGMLSEMKENYKQPLDELTHKKLHVGSILKPKPLTKGEVMSIPGMYSTDYQHIGHNWPLPSVV